MGFGTDRQHPGRRLGRQRSGQSEHHAEENEISHAYVPEPLSTVGTVLARIFASSTSDQLSMYSKSRCIQSSKSIALRPLTCQRQVRPGFIESFRRCHDSNFITSDGNGGRGPTSDISPLSTLNSWGSSSIEYFRRNLPIRVTRGSSLILKTG